MRKTIFTVVISAFCIVLLFVAYCAVSIPPVKRVSTAQIDIDNLSFMDAYTLAQEKLGWFGRLFSLNHIEIGYTFDGKNPHVTWITYGYFYEVISTELYGAEKITLEETSITQEYMRDEPKGISMWFDDIMLCGYEKTLVTFMQENSSLHIDEWIANSGITDFSKEQSIVIFAEGEGKIMWEKLEMRN